MSNIPSVDELIKKIFMAGYDEESWYKVEAWAKAALTRREERIKVEASYDEVINALNTISLSSVASEGLVAYPQLLKRKTYLEQQLKTLDGQEAQL